MTTQLLEMNQECLSAHFQMIRDEHLSGLVITSQTLAGSRVLRSTYQQVVFSGCVFYGVEFQSVTFYNCVFVDCSFDFSHLRNCKFVNCSFDDCRWMATSFIQCLFDSCELTLQLAQLIEQNGNLWECHESALLPLAC
jgi:uncharacterized protein YjbI with pentapeptide repeats